MEPRRHSQRSGDDSDDAWTTYELPLPAVSDVAGAITSGAGILLLPVNWWDPVWRLHPDGSLQEGPSSVAPGRRGRPELADGSLVLWTSREVFRLPPVGPAVRVWATDELGGLEAP